MICIDKFTVFARNNKIIINKNEKISDLTYTNSVTGVSFKPDGLNNSNIINVYARHGETFEVDDKVYAFIDYELVQKLFIVCYVENRKCTIIQYNTITGVEKRSVEISPVKSIKACYSVKNGNFHINRIDLPYIVVNGTDLGYGSNFDPNSLTIKQADNNIDYYAYYEINLGNKVQTFYCKLPADKSNFLFDSSEKVASALKMFKSKKEKVEKRSIFYAIDGDYMIMQFMIYFNYLWSGKNLEFKLLNPSD